ncbi:hypothetical protein CASFOL_006942 [Castilleja foliolosa]|uniref:Uncharacterized protein n=1 Tax=Castilleja foliolosa TaxID=1961234 RepID=A0ABD3EBX8_9LAMI
MGQSGRSVLVRNSWLGCRREVETAGAFRWNLAIEKEIAAADSRAVMEIPASFTGVGGTRLNRRRVVAHATRDSKGAT